MGIDTIAEIAASLAIVVNQVIDKKKRAQFQEALDDMSERQLIEVNEKMLQKKLLTDKIAILSQAVTDHWIQKKRNDQYKKALYLAGTGVIVIVAFVFIFKVIKAKS